MLTRAVLLLFCAAVAGGCGNAARHEIRLRPTSRASLADQALDRSASIIRHRLQRLGFGKVDVRRDGRELVISSPEALPMSAVDVATTKADLAFYDLETSLIGRSVHAGQVVASTSMRELLAQEPRRAVPPKAVIVTCGKAGDRFCPGVNDAPPRRVYYYLFRHDPAKHVPALTAADLTRSGARANLGPIGDPIVLLQFTRRGDRRFQEVTRAEYVRGRRRNLPQHFAIVLDNDIKSFPQIDFTDPQLAAGISGGGQITGIGSMLEAKRLAVVLETGELPLRFARVR